MDKFISDLYDYICEHTPSPRNDPEYRQAVKAYEEIEKEVKEKIGDDLLDKYKYAERTVACQWEAALILQTLRFSHRFTLEMLR